MAMDFEDFDNEADEALKQTDEKNLSLPILLAVQLNSIINISSREFHKGIVLYTDGGMVKGYLPDMLESYCNAVENLSILLSPYHNTEYKNELKELSKEATPEQKRDYAKDILKRCMKLIKDLGLLPDEGANIAEIIGKTRGHKKDVLEAEVEST